MLGSPGKSNASVMESQVVIAAAVLVGTLGVMALASASTDNTKVLHLRDTIIQQKNLDLGDSGFSLGDQFIYGGDLYRSGKKVGTDGVVCTTTRVAGDNSESQCQITLRLPEGQITTQGRLPTGRLNVFAITGGTGPTETPVATSPSSQVACPPSWGELSVTDRPSWLTARSLADATPAGGARPTAAPMSPTAKSRSL